MSVAGSGGFNLFEGYMVEGEMAITCRGLMKLERMPLMVVVMAILCGVLRFAPHVRAQTSSSCGSANLSGSSGRTFQSCQQLPKLGATLAWTVREDEDAIDFAFSGYIQIIPSFLPSFPLAINRHNSSVFLFSVRLMQHFPFDIIMKIS